MNRSRLLVSVVAVIATGVAPSAAVAAHHAAAGKTLKPPKSGHWKLIPGTDIGGGGFGVTGSHSVRKLKLSLTSAATECGKGSIKVLGTFKTHYIPNGIGGYEWVVGKHELGQVPTYNPIKVKVVYKKKKHPATLEMSFNAQGEAGAPTYGFLRPSGLASSECELNFAFKHG